MLLFAYIGYSWYNITVTLKRQISSNKGDSILYRKTCKACGSVFMTNRSNKVYCDNKCHRELLIRMKREFSGKDIFIDSSLPTGTVGAIHELAVCVDLMRKGFHIFRAQSPSCPCDLICLGENGALRIEVKTGQWLANGRVSRPTVKPRFDILALVLHSGEIIYHDSEFNVIDMPYANEKPAKV